MQKFVLYLLVFLLPTQLGLHFWPSFSRVAGIKIDYLSPTIYLSFVFLILYLLINIRIAYHFFIQNSKTVLLASLFMIQNSYFSISPINTLIWWARYTLLFLFVVVLKHNKVKITDVIRPLGFSIILVILVQLFQFLNQGSLGGLLYYLGERNFSYSTPGISKVTFFGESLLRVPSTFSHPNSLAGYFLLVLFMIPASSFMILPILGILLAFSKSAFLALIIYLLFSKYSKPVIILIVTISLLSLIFISNIALRTNNFALITDNSLSSRLSLVSSAHDILAKYPLTGVGLGNFIPALAQELPGSHLTTEHLQPVHNIFLLLLTELGFPIFILFIYKFICALRTNNQALITMLALASMTGFFDHYWLTLPQNQLLLSLLLGIL